jgi:hypothetical protein
VVNAFWLDRDPDQAARWLVDDHVTSSVFECSMVLTTAGHVNGLDEDSLYVTHTDHPLTQWASASFANWSRLREYTRATHEEWRYRWDHAPEDAHECWATVAAIDAEALRALEWPCEDESDPPQVTGEWSAADYVDAYRYYYANEKGDLFAWSKDRNAPPWIDEYTVSASDGG